MIEIKNRYTYITIYTSNSTNLRNADLRSADLQGANLRNANLRNADLRNADLRNADLRNADLQGANLRGADLQGADLQGAAIVLIGLKWVVYITRGHIRIGCQSHSLSVWEAFSDDDISDMDSDALSFWKQYGNVILTVAEELNRER